MAEWCESWYPGYEGTRRVYRGGSAYEFNCSVTSRGANYLPSSTGGGIVGFRVARNSDQ